MDPVRPKRGSKGSGSSRSERSNSRASQKSDKEKFKSKRNSPVEAEKEVTFEDTDVVQEQGFTVEDTETEEETDVDAEKFQGDIQNEEGAQELDDEHLEPYIDEEAVKAELGELEPNAADVAQRGAQEKDEMKDAKTTEEEEEEIETAAPKNRRGRKLKKVTEKKTAFDGREVVFVTEFTQTDWKWKDNVERSGRGRVLAASSEGESPTTGSLKSILVKPESRQTTSQARTEEESTLDDRTGTDLTPFSLQPNDEFGIPMLDMSSDSDSSDDDAPKKARGHKHHLPSIGPPQILKYIRESDRMDKDTDRTSSTMDDEYRQIDSTDYVLDQEGNVAGMFSGPCEFCGIDIKPFPSLEQQLSQPPESLYCCEDYREFVEFAMTTADRLEQDVAKKNEKISIKVHAHHGSKQARKMAKEQAVQRMRERELQRRQQEASGLQAAYYQSLELKENDSAANTKVSQDTDDHQEQTAIEKETEIHPSPDSTEVPSTQREKRRKTKTQKVKDLDEVDWVAAEFAKIPKLSWEQSSESSSGGKEEKKKATNTKKDGEQQQLPSNAMLTVPSPASGMSPSPTLGQIPRSGSGTGLNPASQLLSAGGSFSSEVARQMKTINYQLSSQKCLEEGWTLRAPSPLDLDDLDAEVFIPEPLHPAMIASGKLHDRKLIEKFYPDGSKFLTMFPDGTGNVFYPSGKLAILIISISLGQYTYLVQDDSNDPEILAVFEPNGYGCCYWANGKVRLTYDQHGGMELDYGGGRKRSWSWRDQETHVHAPPFQPIVFGMNRYLGVRFMAQESIALTLTGRKRSCRFNVGAKLKLVAPENIVPKGIDENQLFIDERKVKVDHILNKVSTLLKFPKSPKVDRILPPLSVASRQQKVDKMKEEYAATLTVPSSVPTRRQKKIVKQSRLSPLPAVSVN